MKQGTRDGIKLALSAAVVVIAIILVGVYGFGWFQKETAGFRGEVAETERVEADPNFRIASYEEFYELCAAVQAKEAAIVQQEQMLAQTPDPTRQQQLQSNLAALASSRASLIAEYNSKAERSRTRGKFLGSELPDQLNANAEGTQCSVS